MKTAGKIISHLFLLIVFILLLIVIFHFGLFFLYNGKVYPGVYLGNQPLGGASFSGAKQQAESALASLEQDKMILTYDGFSMSLPAASFELKFDSAATVRQIYLLGRTGNLIRDFQDEITAIIFTKKVSPVFSLNQDAVDQFLASAAESINRPSQDAGLVIVDGDLLLKSEEKGKEIEVKKFETLFLHQIGILENEVIVPVNNLEPKLRIDEIQAQVPLAKKILQQPLKLSFDDQSWEINNTDISQFLSFEFQKEKTAIILVPKVKDRDYLLRKIDKLTKDFSQQFKSAQLKQIGDKTVALTIPEEGKVLDLEKTVDAVDNYYQKGAKEGSVDLMVVYESAATLAKRGIINVSQSIGVGESHFPVGSGQEARAHNITVAAQKINDTLVAPDATFSTNATMGEISYETGYWSGLALIGNRYVAAIGGGVCEVSTVLFRAALDSGMEITSRTPHGTVIYHYDWPQRGLDSTIFPDTGLDFTFHNNTQGYILIQTKVDEKNGVLRIEFLSDQKRREVTLSTAKIFNVVWSGDPMLITDTSLKPGEKRLLEVAAEGCDVEITRTIKENGVSTEELIKSHYRPWRAVYLVGG